MAFEENKHPRAKDGKFTSKGNEGAGSDSTQKEKEVTTKRDEKVDFTINPKNQNAFTKDGKDVRQDVLLGDIEAPKTKDGVDIPKNKQKKYNDIQDKIKNFKTREQGINLITEIALEFGLENGIGQEILADLKESFLEKGFSFGNWKKKDFSNEYDQKIIKNGKDYWVNTDEDEKIWNSLSDEDKHLLAVSGGSGNYNDWKDNYENDYRAENRYKELREKFSHYKEDNEENERKRAYELFNLPF